MALKLVDKLQLCLIQIGHIFYAQHDLSTIYRQRGTVSWYRNKGMHLNNNKITVMT